MYKSVHEIETITPCHTDQTVNLYHLCIFIDNWRPPLHPLPPPNYIKHNLFSHTVAPCYFEVPRDVKNSSK